MEIRRHGATRVVILVGNHAIKVGRIKFLHFLGRVMALIFSCSERKGLIERHGQAPLRGIKNGIFPGLEANLNEYRYYMESKDPRVMPVLKKMLWGLVIIQQRGVPVSPAELAANHPFQMAEDDTCDLARAEQFCWRTEDLRIVLVDFGMARTVEFLRTTMSVSL